MRTKNIGAYEFPRGPKASPIAPGMKLGLMARSGGYVMVRHPRAVPFVMHEKDWCALPDFTPDHSKGR